MKAGIDYIGVGVGALIVQSNKVLLLLRKKDPEAESWSVPGGKVEFGEEIEAAIIREIKEEIGVDSKIIKLLGVANHILTNPAKHFVSPQFLVEIHGIPKNMEMESHKEIRWFNINKLPINISLSTKIAIEIYINMERHITI